MTWLQGRLNGKAAATASKPLARTDECVVEYVGDEVLIYDQRTKEAHCLGQDAAMVWRVCDGRTDAAGIASALAMDETTVRRAIDELEACSLLGAPPAEGATRREVTSRMVKYGAGAVVAVPLIYSIAAPTPALAASEKFCLALCPSSCGAGGCSGAGCCCCSPGGGNLKVCAIDCAHCTQDVLNQNHCGETLTSVSCSAGC